MKTSSAFLDWALVVCWALLIWMFSSLPDLKSGLPTFWDFFFRKLAHATEFGVFAILLDRASLGSRQQSKPRFSFWFAATIAILYAVSDEWHQRFVPGRVGSPWDVGIDASGVALFLFFWKKSRFRKAKPKAWSLA